MNLQSVREFLSGERSYNIESNPPIYNMNPLTGFCIVGEFSGGYSQTDCKFYFNINVNVTVTVDSYMNSGFNFSFSHY